METKVIIPWLDVGMKYSVLFYSMYYLFVRCVSEKLDRGKQAAALFFSVVLGFSLIRIRPVFSPMHIPLMLVYVTLTNFLLYRDELNGKAASSRRLKLSDITVLSLLCFTFCEAIFMIVGFVSSAILSVIYYDILHDSQGTVMDFLNDIPFHIAAYFVMIFAVWATVYLAAGMKRLRRGLMAIAERRSGGIGIMMAILLLTVCTAFAGFSLGPSHEAAKTILLAFTMTICVVMIYWIKKEISAEYLRQLRERNIELLEKSHAEKDKEIASLVGDSESLADTVRLDSRLIPLLIDAAKGRMDASAVRDTAEQLERLYATRSAAISNYENCGRNLVETGVKSVDAVLLYMAERAEKNRVDFELQAQNDISDMLIEATYRREFNTLLADLVENAIISAGGAKDGAVAVIIKKAGDSCCLEVWDSGERFDSGVLKKMGKRRITTHSGEGGSGIGLMTIFKILRHTGASFAIEEFPVIGDFSGRTAYTKAVRVIFDGAGKRTIITDRADELSRSVRDGFEVVKRSA